MRDRFGEKIDDGHIELVRCDLRLGTGIDDVYRYRKVMSAEMWNRMPGHSRRECKEAAIDEMMREINEFVHARKALHRHLDGLEASMCGL